MADKPADTEYREATEEDFNAIAYVWREGARAIEGAAFEIPTLNELRSRIDLEIASGWIVTVAIKHREIVGFLALKPDSAILDQLFVLPSRQGYGIGRRLLDHAKRAMPDGFTLRTAASNHKARRFYVNSGLALVQEGLHPRSGHPVCYYGWNVRA